MWKITSTGTIFLVLILSTYKIHTKERERDQRYLECDWYSPYILRTHGWIQTLLLIYNICGLLFFSVKINWMAEANIGTCEFLYKFPKARSLTTSQELLYSNVLGKDHAQYIQCLDVNNNNFQFPASMIMRHNSLSKCQKYCSEISRILEN